MKKILLFGGGLQILAIARGLKETGYIVDVLGTHNEISKRCRYVRRCIQIDIDNISVNDFVKIINDEMYSVIIPTEDEYSSWLSINKSKVEQLTKSKCAIADYSIYEIASDKSRLLQFCKENNFPHPKTAIIDSNLAEAAEYVGFPALIKPNYSAGSRGIKRVNNINELIELSKGIIDEYGECSLQEFITNDHYYNVMLYRTNDGRWGNHVITKITRYYPINGGSSSFCTTINNDKLLSICKEILDKLGWVGFADFDVLEKDTGDFRIIEINPRVPASVRAAAISGVNFGEMIVSDILKNQLPTYQYTTNKQLRYLGLDLAWFISSPNRFKCKPSWFKFFGTDLYYQEGGYKDIWAMLTSLYIGIKKFLSPTFRKAKAGMN